MCFKRLQEVSERYHGSKEKLRKLYSRKFHRTLALGSNIRDEDTKNFEIDTLTLRFVDKRSECAFVTSRASKLAFYMAVGCALISAYVGIVLVSQIQSGWLTCGGALVDTIEAHRIGSSRNTLFFIIFFCSFVHIPTWLANRKWQFLSPKGQELAAIILCSIMAVLVMCQHPWYFSQILGVKDRASLFRTGQGVQDFELLLYVDVFVASSHLILPVRGSVMWVYEAIVVVVFISLMSSIGIGRADGMWLICAVTVISLTGMASLGMRNRELFERTQFAHLACERTLRAQAEFRLQQSMVSRLGPSAQVHEAAGEDPPAQEARTEEQASEVTYKTGVTGEIFRLSGAENKQEVQAALQKITTLGMQEHWLIAPAEVKSFPDTVLGKGGFGVVLRGTYHGAVVALKAPIAPLGEGVLMRTLRTSIEELRILRRLRHPNIVLFYGACIEPATCDVLLVLEYVSGQQLHKAIPPYPPAVKKDLEPRCKLADDICCALAYLHAQRPSIIHGDIKSTNVLVENTYDRPRAKLLDFGLSRLLTRNARKLGGTLRWMAPEVMTQTPGSIATSADVFSFGRLLYMLMTGKLPLDQAGRPEILAAAKRGKSLPLEWPAQMLFDRKCRELCDACLGPVPQNRPCIAEVQAQLRSWQVDSLRDRKPRSEAELSATLEQARSSLGSVLPSMSKVSRCPERDTRAELLHPNYSETPHESCRLSIAQAMCAWNLPVKPSDCCSYHVLIRKACEISHTLNATGCSKFKPDVTVQCPECHLIGHVRQGECMACGFQSMASLSSPSAARSGLMEQLESIQEVAHGNDDGTPGAAERKLQL